MGTWLERSGAATANEEENHSQIRCLICLCLCDVEAAANGKHFWEYKRAWKERNSGKNSG